MNAKQAKRARYLAGRRERRAQADHVKNVLFESAIKATMKAEDKKTGIAIRFVKEWDIEVDQRPTRMEHPTYDDARALFPLKHCTRCDEAFYTNAPDPFICRECVREDAAL